jgi:outer membrane protein OmpA-like peptidoglycan-associated protein
MRRPIVAALAAAALAAFPASSVDAQSWLEKAKQKAKEKAAETVDKKTEKPAEKPAEATARPAVSSGEGATATPAANSGAAAPAERPGEGAWANYDFKPGDRILYADDFMKDEVGDFPKRMEFKEGALEIVDWKGTRFLRATNDSRFFVVLPEALPERFTIEFDYLIPNRGEVWIDFGDDNRRVEFGGAGNTDVYNGDTRILASSREETGEDATRLRRGRILADGKYIKVYLDDKRTLNVPNADLGRTNKIQFYTDGDPAKPTLFGNFRVAAGGKKLYDALTESGRVATQGIYFDTGSDRIRAESTPTLKEIGAMLTEHADLKLTIEGHTDDVGAAAANQALSEKRAEAVKAFIVSTYGVDAARITAKGLGSTKPAVQGTTPEARQQNRRVELVKM